MYVSETIIVYSLNLHSDICQLFLNKTGKKEKKKEEFAQGHMATGRIQTKADWL